ncbi:MAG: amidase [Alphaproteobacteria bacterium]|jgi:amidase|nr:amidase [Alphaproteobacteria bacterium]
MDSELWRWQACDLAHAIRTRRISSREAVASCLGRLEQVNPRINAVVDVLADEALTAADRADRAVAAGEALGTLHGVPVTYKINMDYAGRPTTDGVVAFKDRMAKVDNPAIANWRKAGAIAIGRTNVPPFSARFFTSNALHGRTLNPWDAGRTPGGSSGGAAAAVATGIGPLAHGSDRAGSVRYPAYACGVLGLRPTIGRIPSFNATAPEDASLTTQITHTQGPLARSVRDLRLGYAAMATGDPHDPWWTPVDTASQGLVHPGPVALFTENPGAEMDPAISATLRAAAGWLEDAGYRVEQAAPPHFEEIARLFFTLIRSEERSSTTSAIDRLGDDQLRRARASTMSYASELDYDGYIKAFGRRAAILREWQLFFERYPLLVMPVSSLRPVPVDYDQQGNEAVAHMLRSHHPMLAISMLGLPGLAVPTGQIRGVPVGVQLVSGRFREDICLTAAEVIEARYPASTPIEPRG